MRSASKPTKKARSPSPRNRKAAPTRPRSAPSRSPRRCWSPATPITKRRNPRRGPGLEALHGSLYIAKPFANPFGSLIAVYLVVEDKKTRIVAKLAGKGELDPGTGQITTFVRENPELALQDVGSTSSTARAGRSSPRRPAVSSPPKPTSPPERPRRQTRHPGSSFQTTATPRGGSCPTGESQLPNAPKLTPAPRTPPREYSPLIFKVSREDAGQRLGKIEATCPAASRPSWRESAPALSKTSPRPARAKHPGREPSSRPTPAARPHLRSASSTPPPRRAHPLLHPRPRLPRPPLQGRPALDRGDRPRRRRSL